MDQAGALIGLLADDDRLRVVAALALGHEHPKELIDVTGLDARRVGLALGGEQKDGAIVDHDLHLAVAVLDANPDEPVRLWQVRR